jgi:hypothetical protein
LEERKGELGIGEEGKKGEETEEEREGRRGGRIIETEGRKTNKSLPSELSYGLPRAQVLGLIHKIN